MNYNKIFDYSDYKKYVLAWIKSQPAGGRGIQGRLARSMECHSTHISLVLSGKNHFSIEQADRFSVFAGHSQEESFYFQLMIHYGRANIKHTQDIYFREMKNIASRYLDKKIQNEVGTALSLGDKAIYYSAWYYAAVHIGILVPSLQSKDALVRHFHLSSRIVQEVIEFLLRTGLATQNDGKLQVGKSTIHLEADSPFISKHHSNWRTKTLGVLDRMSPEELHYSSVVALSEGDAIKVRAILTKAIEQVRATVKASPEEAVFCYCLDLYPLETQN